MKRVSLVLLVFMNTTASALPQAERSGSPGTANPARSRVYKMEELTYPQIADMNRERTLVILPIGMMEEHGPHLPVGADIFGVLYEANEVSRRVSEALPDWTVLMMPPVNYGQGGANEIGGVLVHPGTYAISQSTLRSMLAEIGGQIAQNGFRWIFVMNGHAAPRHNVAINEACDFISDTFKVTMLHLTGLFKSDGAIQAQGDRINEKYFSPADLRSFGMDVHAGVSETSAMLAIRPDLVHPGYQGLPDRAGHDFGELHKIASKPGWQGYLSSPAKANQAYGRAVEAWWVAGFTDLVLRAVRGENLFNHPRYPETDLSEAALGSVLENAMRHEQAFQQKLDKWLAQRNKR